MNAVGKGLLSASLGMLAFGLLLFVPAGTLHYWQAWVFLAVFVAATWIPSLYLLRTNPAALDRRMRFGPRAEPRPRQRLVITAIFICFPALFFVSALDHRLGWSTVPTAVCLLGDALVAAGLGLAMVVIVQNGYAAANVAVEAGQPLVSTGLYAVVRHPMYVGNVLLMAGTPLALGSYWGLAFLLPGVALLAVRLLDEERMLTEELPGYREYTDRVRYRLVPHLW
ncbi:methyltransferase family protein [Mycolicibacter hiberniae]|uniref:Membrane protein n=1 Tax=Mycolicibacter hiberniae TaxID=29314 RepID=A0A7I7X0A4_9MYCO|nr:isoprenylcysteine carboxylmethyltransferase family protein [Mycolicibacter hiberniae]MCV7086700.1 isoprenylcysteine carboxylmethyltransferase family protein [Mycolicibacter hiberniae]ORV67039.1 hypothetical protein AWC09_19210 [Mycolicibacter hiberniae]BBZ22287.1 membrane protein [Mycolicibacter hiberniae]